MSFSGRTPEKPGESFSLAKFQSYNKFMLRGIALFFIAACSAASMACQIAITNIEMCDATGAVAPWSYSAQFIGARVSWSVTGAPAAPYMIKFVFADSAPIMQGPFNGPGNFVCACATSYPSLFALPVSVTIDPANVSGNTTPATALGSRTFTAAPPASTIAKYGSQTLFAKQSMSVPISSGKVSKMVMLLGRPTSDTFQTVQTITATGAAVSTQPTGYPAWERVFANIGPGTYSLSQTFKTTVSNVACNTALIRSTWAQMDALNVSMKNYLGAEQFVETADPNLIAFAHASLPANYRTTLTPLQTAEKLFASVVRAITYKTPFTGDAMTVFQSKLGDCGGMTNLYSTCLRIVGIPCRSVCGWWTDQTTHCWSEIFFPGVGWIPADTSLSRKVSTTCAFLPFFAYSPSSNQRCAVCRAGTLNTLNISTGAVQIGAWTWVPGGTVAPSVGAMTSTVSLSTTPLP